MSKSTERRVRRRRKKMIAQQLKLRGKKSQKVAVTENASQE
jgi:hypothetical protein